MTLWHAFAVLAIGFCCDRCEAGEPLSGTQPLSLEGDIASILVDGVDRFLLNKVDQSRGQRQRHWMRDFRSAAAYWDSLQPNRDRLASILGLRDERVSPVEMTAAPAFGGNIIGAFGKSHTVRKVNWPVIRDPDPRRSLPSVWAEGLLVTPVGRTSFTADVIAIPDCEHSAAQFAGVVDGVPSELQYARRLAEYGCRVLIPTTISRELKQRNGRSTLTNREFVYRPSFVLGRHIIGYELQQVFAALDWLQQNPAHVGTSRRPTGIVGYGEGGRFALFAAALDNRFEAVGLSASFGPMESIWHEPLDRNVFGLLDEFGGAEMLSMLAPRPVVIEHRDGPTLELQGDRGGAPAKIESIDADDAATEVERAIRLVEADGNGLDWPVKQLDGRTSDTFVEEYIKALTRRTLPERVEQQHFDPDNFEDEGAEERLMEQLDRHNQLVLRESEFVRNEFMKGLKTDSLEAYADSVERYRDTFRNDVIGHFDDPLLEPNPRSRQMWEAEKWTGYEVVLDVFPDVIAYGALLLPKGIEPGEKRPVVVCQHGLEGRPTDTFLGDHRAYHDYAAKLADEGFVVFAPQNLYLFNNRFRTLQRKANPLGKTLFSIIVPQHQQIVNWLKEMPFVDGDRIAFYGLSYGGKSAMRIPALVTDYCLSICSADFNEWVRKNASTRDNFSYVWTGEYEIFEWNLGNTFNYAEMAALICPRPFMVERGHFDGVGTDPWVAYEFAKVRHLYAAKLKIPGLTEIEWFDGPHMINGKGTFAFLRKHLEWPQ